MILIMFLDWNEFSFLFLFKLATFCKMSSNCSIYPRKHNADNSILSWVHFKKTMVSNKYSKMNKQANFYNKKTNCEKQEATILLESNKDSTVCSGS